MVRTRTLSLTANLPPATSPPTLSPPPPLSEFSVGFVAEHVANCAAVAQLTADDCQHILQTALALPALLPPGAEATALRTLSTAFQTALLGPALARACQALHSFQAGGSSLTMAAAGLTFEQMQSMHSMHSRQAPSSALDRRSETNATCASASDASQQASTKHPDNGQHSASSIETRSSIVDQQQQPGEEQEEEQEEQDAQDVAGQLYPLEPLPDQAICCQRLLQGYSAAWLGLVPAALTSNSASPTAGPQHDVHALLQPVGKLARHACYSHRLCSIPWSSSFCMHPYGPGL